MRHPLILPVLALIGTLFAASGWADPPCGSPPSGPPPCGPPPCAAPPCAAPPQRIIVETPPAQVFIQQAPSPLLRCCHLGCRHATPIYSAMPTIQAAPIVMQAAAPMMMQAAPMAMQAITPFSIQAAPMAMQAAPFSIQAAPMAMQAAPFAIQAAPMGMQGIAPFSVQGAAPTMTLSPFAASAPAYSVQATPSFSLQLPFNLQMPQATFGPQGTGRAQGALSPQSTKDQPSEASLGDTLIKISNHLDKLHRIADVHTQVLHAHEYRIRALEEFAGSVGDPKNNLAKEVQDELRALWDNAQKKNKEPAK